MACIDQIRLRVECPDHSDAPFVAARDWIASVRGGHWYDIYKEHGTPVGKHCVWSNPQGSTTLGRQPLPGGGSLGVRYGYVAKKWWVWYQFNPARGSPLELAPHFSLLLFDGYRELKKRAVVSEVHVAVDIDDVEYSKFGYLDSRLRTANMAYSKLGTTYLGSPQGKRFIRCYDKAKQLREKHGEKLEHPRLRLEAVVRPVVLRKDILQIANPFLAVYVVDLQALQSTTDPRLAEFRDPALHIESFQPALRALGKKRRRKVFQALGELRPSWAEPNAIWAELPQLFGWEDEIIEASC